MFRTTQKKETVKVEGNLIESFLIHFERDGTPPKNLTEVFKNKNGTISVVHYSRYFTGFDMDVMIAVFTFSKIYDYIRILNATPGDIAKIMKLSNSYKNRTLIKNSIIEIAKSPIEYKGTWYDVNGQKYVITNIFTFLRSSVKFPVKSF